MTYYATPDSEARRASPHLGGRVGFYSGGSAASPPRFAKPLAPQRSRAEPALRRRQTAPATGPSSAMGELLLAPRLVPVPVLRAATRTLDAACVRLGIKRETVRLRWIAPPSRLAGFLDREGLGRGRADVYVRADLSPQQVAVSVAHELRHIWQWMNVQEPDEADAERFGRAFAPWGYQPARI